MDLLVISNHPPDRWSEEQRKGWDTIDYVPFPNVDAMADYDDVLDMAMSLFEQIEMWIVDHEDGRVNIQGEYTLTGMVVHMAYPSHHWIFTYPTSNRVVEEKDGKKISTFKFVRWR